MPSYSQELWYHIPEFVHPLMWKACDIKTKIETGETEYNLMILFLQDHWFIVLKRGDI